MNAELSGISGITRRGAQTPRSPAVGYARGTLSDRECPVRTPATTPETGMPLETTRYEKDRHSLGSCWTVLAHRVHVAFGIQSSFAALSGLVALVCRTRQSVYSNESSSDDY